MSGKPIVVPGDMSGTQRFVYVIRVLHDRMDYRRHLENSEPADE